MRDMKEKVQSPTGAHNKGSKGNLEVRDGLPGRDM